MFSVGEVFVYGVSGVCRIREICARDCGTGEREYYVLQPVFDGRSTLYVPTDSEALLSHLNPLLTEKQVEALVSSMPAAAFDWLPDDKRRTEKFRSILESGDRKELMRMIQTLHDRKKELSERGKKLRSSDESFMQRAEKLLYDEFAFVLGIEPTAVAGYIRERVKE